MTIRILRGDCRDVLTTLPAESVHCVVTSPPYFGLRDYGMPGQIGIENTPDAYVAELVRAFRSLRPALRADGTVWLNLGDSRDKKTGELVGIPWRTALALRDDGWLLFDEVIWSKPYPHPSPVRTRCTPAHEQIFMLAKHRGYYFDAASIAEPSCIEDRPQTKRAHELAEKGGLTPEHIAAIRAHGIADAGKAIITTTGAGRNSADVKRLAGEAKAVLGGYFREFLIPAERNKRTVWEVPTGTYADAHFATFPPALIEPCILAGCPTGGTVLDPFGGAGTTALVADRRGRNAILIEINPEYADMAERRVCNEAGLFAEVTGC